SFGIVLCSSPCPVCPLNLVCSTGAGFFHPRSVIKGRAAWVMKKIDLSPHHPISDIQGNLVIASNGNVVLCHSVRLPEIHSLSEVDFEELHGAWFQGFKSLPVGTVIHK